MWEWGEGVAVVLGIRGGGEVVRVRPRAKSLAYQGTPLLQATASAPEGDSGPATYPLDDANQASSEWRRGWETEPSAGN